MADINCLKIFAKHHKLITGFVTTRASHSQNNEYIVCIVQKNTAITPQGCTRWNCRELYIQAISNVILVYHFCLLIDGSTYTLLPMSQLLVTPISPVYLLS